MIVDGDLVRVCKSSALESTMANLGVINFVTHGLTNDAKSFSYV